MLRDYALALSDRLAKAGFSHEVNVQVHEGMRPRENYTVHIRCNLTMSADEIEQLQLIAIHHGLGLAFVQPAFTFDEQRT